MNGNDTKDSCGFTPLPLPPLYFPGNVPLSIEERYFTVSVTGVPELEHFVMAGNSKLLMSITFVIHEVPRIYDAQNERSRQDESIGAFSGAYADAFELFLDDVFHYAVFGSHYHMFCHTVSSQSCDASAFVAL